MSDRPRLTVSESDRQRVEAVDRLVAAGPRSIPDLLAMLSDASWAVRRAVVLGLGSLGEPAVVPLCDLLRARRDNEARIAATVDALVASTGDVTTPIFELSRDANPAVVADAAQILGRRRNSRSIPRLIELMEHADDNVAVNAIEAVGRIGGRAAVDALVIAVGSGKFFRAFPSIDVLGRSGDPRAVKPLAGLLGTAHFAPEAARALGRTGERSAVAPLTAMLISPADANVRVAALALADLIERHYERSGTRAPIEEALRGAANSQPVIRRLSQCIVGAEPLEQMAICVLLGTLGTEAAIPALTRLLDSAGVATAAANALKRIGRKDSESELLRALREGDSARRQVLLPAVGHVGASNEVIACLTDADAAVRSLAADALANIGNPRAVPALFKLLQDPNPRVVQAAVAAIQSLGSTETERLALEAATSPQAGVRRAAMRILSYFGYAAALEMFLAATKDSDARVRDGAIQGLPFLEDPRAVDAVLEIARSTDDRARASAMRALGQCTDDLKITSFLLRGLSDPAPWVRYYACQSLGKLAFEGSALAIAHLLADDAGQVRVAAVEALSHLESPHAFEALCRAVQSAEPDVHRAALIGLGIGRRTESLPILLKAAMASEPATRLVALSAMADFTPEQILPALARAASDVDESVQTAAIGFLASSPAVEATKVLIDFLQDSSLHQRILGALATPSVERVHGIATTLETADDQLAQVLTSTLARLKRPDATAAIFQALGLPNVAARKAAASTLAALGTREALAALERASTTDSDPGVRRVCVLVLAQ